MTCDIMTYHDMSCYIHRIVYLPRLILKQRKNHVRYDFLEMGAIQFLFFFNNFILVIATMRRLRIFAAVAAAMSVFFYIFDVFSFS